MEFPDLGDNCSEPTCKKFDFLPIRCDTCMKIFCGEHFKYSAHRCPNADKNNVQVPICPLCESPVPTPSGQQPDVFIRKHISRKCQPSTTPIYTNKCSYRGCKTKELIPVVCQDCKRNYCFKHRHPMDHKCAGPPLPKQTSNGLNVVRNSWDKNKTRSPPSTSFNTAKDMNLQYSKLKYGNVKRR